MLISGQLITSDKHEKAFLGGIERFVGIDRPELIKAVPNILMACYEDDLIDEETITAWGSKPSKKYTGDRDISKKVRGAAAPFLKWLEEAESDDEDDDE